MTEKEAILSDLAVNAYKVQQGNIRVSQLQRDLTYLQREREALHRELGEIVTSIEIQ